MFEAKHNEQKALHEQMLREHKAQMDLFVGSHKDHSETHVSESRALISSLRSDVEQFSREKHLLDKDLSDEKVKSAALRDDVIKVCLALFKAHKC